MADLVTNHRSSPSGDVAIARHCLPLKEQGEPFPEALAGRLEPMCLLPGHLKAPLHSLL